MTQIRIKDNETIHISGYVNAVDRFSRPLTDYDGKTFVEKIKPTAFGRALNEASDIGIKLNHEREITTVNESGAELFEDNVGLYFNGEIKDEEIVRKAKNNELVGWSFGFYPTEYEDKESESDFVNFERVIKSLRLVEITLVDNNALPAYPATSIYSRCKVSDDTVQLRLSQDDFTIDNEAEKRNTDELNYRMRQIELLKL